MKTLLLGWYGQKNVGDDILLINAINFAKDVFKSEQISFFVKYKYKNSEIFDGLNQLSSQSNIKGWYIIKHFINIYKCDLLIFGGGSQFSEDGRKGLINIYINKLFVNFARFMNKKIVILQCSLGPTTTLMGEQIVKKIANDVNFLIVRDNASKNYISGDYFLSNDPAPRVIKNMGLSNAKNNFCKEVVHIGLSLSSSQDHKFQLEILTGFSNAIKLMSKEFNKIHLYVFQFCANDSSNDFIYEDLINECMSNSCRVEFVGYNENTKEFINKIAGMDVMICQRLHAAICSYSLSVPFVALNTSEKIEQFSTEVNNKNIVKKNQLSDSDVYIKQIRSVLSDFNQELMSVNDYISKECLFLEGVKWE